MVYEYRRIELNKADALAKEVLELDPNNCYAHYILARNKKDINTKI